MGTLLILVSDPAEAIENRTTLPPGALSLLKMTRRSTYPRVIRQFAEDDLPRLTVHSKFCCTKRDSGKQNSPSSSSASRTITQSLHHQQSSPPVPREILANTFDQTCSPAETKNYINYPQRCCKQICQPQLQHAPAFRTPVYHTRCHSAAAHCSPASSVIPLRIQWCGNNTEWGDRICFLVWLCHIRLSGFYGRYGEYRNTCLFWY